MVEIPVKKQPVAGKWYVYFIKAGAYVKVGVSRSGESVIKRLRSMQTGNPLDLELIGVIPRVNKGTEIRAQKFLAEDHVRGEWFWYRERTTTYISAYSEQRIVNRLCKDHRRTAKAGQRPKFLSQKLRKRRNRARREAI